MNLFLNASACRLFDGATQVSENTRVFRKKKINIFSCFMALPLLLGNSEYIVGVVAGNSPNPSHLT
jgi:hypothetical protein